MDIHDIEHALTRKGVKPTSNRILVYRAISSARNPLSLTELVADIQTLDKSSIFRVLNLFLAHDLIHSVEDGSGSMKYETCRSEGQCSVSDMHIHFHCEHCGRTLCLESLPVPLVNLPAGFDVHSVTYMVKGICPDCQNK